MLTRRIGSLAIGALIVSLAMPSAQADDDAPVVGSQRGCEGKGLTSFVTTCAAAPGAPGGRHPVDDVSGAKSRSGRRGHPTVTCRVTKLDPQPPADSVMWNGHKPGDGGAIYNRTCFEGNKVLTAGPDWFAAPPRAQAVDPQVVARKAVDRMRLAKPDIQSPTAGGTYVVGMPMWLHLGQSPTTFGPISATAAAGGVKVTATAKVSSVRWSMGDDTAVVCQGPGTAYNPSFGKRPSPDCGYRYTHTSARQSGKRYTVTATATWLVTWHGAGQQGEFTETRRSEVRVAVGELQALG